MTFPDEDPQEKPWQNNEEPSSSDEEEKNVPQTNSDTSELVFTPTEDTGPEFDYSRMEDDVAAFRRELDSIQLPSAEDAPEIEFPAATDQMSRRRRRFVQDKGDVNKPNEQLETLAKRASANIDFFILSFVCGIILGLGYILDSPAILIMGILAAPLLGPWMGTTLSTATGEIRLFGQTFGGILTSLLLVFIPGMLAGFILRFIDPLTSSQAFHHSRLWWPDLLMLVLGTAILIIGFIKSEDKPVIANLMVAYELFLPFSAAAFGLGSGVPGLWPEAGLVFLIHLALSLITGLIIFFFMGFRPSESKGYALVIGTILIVLLILSGFSGFGSFIKIRGDEAYATPNATYAFEALPSTSIATLEILPHTATPTSSASPQPSQTPFIKPSPTRPVYTLTPIFSPTPSLVPTTVFGRIQTISSDGVTVRSEPGGTGSTTAANGYLVQLLNEAPVTVDGITWLHVIIKTPSRDIVGWVQSILVQTATPAITP
jgi:uncharacterized membrane protein